MHPSGIFPPFSTEYSVPHPDDPTRSETRRQRKNKQVLSEGSSTAAVRTPAPRASHRDSTDVVELPLESELPLPFATHPRNANSPPSHRVPWPIETHPRNAGVPSSREVPLPFNTHPRNAHSPPGHRVPWPTTLRLPESSSSPTSPRSPRSPRSPQSPPCTPSPRLIRGASFSGLARYASLNHTSGQEDS